MSQKEEAINNIFHDRSGYGSIKKTYDDAKKKDSSITLKDVKEWFQKNVQQKKQLRGFNSFVAPFSNYEYQVDLFFINDLPEQKYKVGMMMIDVFSKYMVVLPLTGKTEGDIGAGLIEGFVKMGTPEFLYTDDETALSTEAMKTYFKEHNIHHIITRGHANVAERAIRTFKDALYKRIDLGKNKNAQWSDLIFEILLTYNNKNVHSTINMTPSNARQKTNQTEVRTNTFINSTQSRTYPTIKKGDGVKIFRKKKVGEKERTSVWSENSYEIEDIHNDKGLIFYKLVGLEKQYLRHELLKV